MSALKGKTELDDSYAIHEFYMTVINSLPDVIYWVDAECHLQGCNRAFVKLLGLKELKDFKGTPYDQMRRFAQWSEERVNQLRLDDMEAIFTAEAKYNTKERPIIEKNNNHKYFQSSRVPYFDKANKVKGLIVTLTEIPGNTTIEESAVTMPNTINYSNDSIESGHLPTILMIEDNLIAQCVEKAILTSLDCQVDVADTEEEALKLFSPGKYDVVLMDLGLENTSGYVVAKKLRQSEKDTEYHVPIIALTSFDADVVKEDCEQYFMEGAITKPLTCEQAEQIIKHYVYHLDIPIKGLKHS